MGFADRDFLGFVRWLIYRGVFGKRAAGHDAKEDYFSQLPHDVLSSIIAHLTVKEAARTCILSRRWRYRFASTAPLRFRCLDMLGFGHYDHNCCLDYQKKIWKGVNDQLLQRYSGGKVAHVEMTFCLWRMFSGEFGQWMHSISRLGVEKLCLYFNCGTALLASNYNPDPNNMFKFSLELLSEASSLEHLLLCVCTVQPSLGVHLNSLKTLTLKGVLLARGQLEGILSCCLNLNHLQLEYCRLPVKLCISGRVTCVLFTSCGGLEAIDLQATNLRRFECSFKDKVRFCFSSVPLLEHVMIYLRGDASLPYIFGDFAIDLPAHVKSLIVKACHSEVKYFPTEPKIFRNLRKLALVLLCTYDFDIVKISPVLVACPLLRELDLVQASTRRQTRGGGIRSPLSPTYHTELKEVTFGGFHLTGEEVEFAIYILRSAMVLELMCLSPHYRWYSGCGIWKMSPTNSTCFERESMSIRRELRGQAISRNAVVIIE